MTNTLSFVAFGQILDHKKRKNWNNRQTTEDFNCEKPFETPESIEDIFNKTIPCILSNLFSTRNHWLYEKIGLINPIQYGRPIKCFPGASKGIATNYVLKHVSRITPSFLTLIF